jgi:hypothetical protein
MNMTNNNQRRKRKLIALVSTKDKDTKQIVNEVWKKFQNYQEKDKIK